jgi:hypothetical protein
MSTTVVGSRNIDPLKEKYRVVSGFTSNTGPKHTLSEILKILQSPISRRILDYQSTSSLCKNRELAEYFILQCWMEEDLYTSEATRRAGSIASRCCSIHLQRTLSHALRVAPY